MRSNQDDSVVKSDELTLNWLKFFKFWSESRSDFVQIKRRIVPHSLFADALAKIMTDDEDYDGSHPIGYVRSLEQVLELKPSAKSGQSPSTWAVRRPEIPECNNNICFDFNNFEPFQRHECSTEGIKITSDNSHTYLDDVFKTSATREVCSVEFQINKIVSLHDGSHGVCWARRLKLIYDVYMCVLYIAEISPIFSFLLASFDSFKLLFSSRRPSPSPTNQLATGCWLNSNSPQCVFLTSQPCQISSNKDTKWYV